MLALLTATTTSSCKHENLQERFKREAAEYTKKNCPQKIDQVTVLDSITFATDKNQYCYYYSIEGDGAVELVKSQSDGFHKMLLDGVRNSTKLVTEKEAEVTFTYTYRSKQSGEEILHFDIKPTDYK